MKLLRNQFLFLAVFLLASSGVRAQLTVQIGQNFTGSTYSIDTTALPPDPNGCIGPVYFMEFINGNVAVYDKTTGVQTMQPVSDLTFWSDAGVILASSAAVSDPRVIYDPTVQRWFATQVDFDAAAADPVAKANHFLFAVSDTSDPTGSWHGFKFQADPNHGDFADFPTLGLDANAIYISGDMFRSVQGVDTPIGSGLVSIPKSDLLGPNPTVANRTWFGVTNYNVHGQVLQPVVCTDGSSSGNIVATGDVGTDPTFYSNLVCFAVVNGGATNATLTTPSNLTVSPYTVPFNNNLGYPGFAPAQPDGPPNYLAGNDARFSAHVFGVSGVLYAVHSTEVNGRTAVRWYRLSATNYAVLESGTISDPALDLFFPAIAANANGTVVIACNGSGPGAGQYVSCYAYAGQTLNGTTAFGGRILFQSGQTSYHGDDEIFAQLDGDPISSRWGDYSTITVDPDNPTHFWSIMMFPSDAVNNDVYSTQITELVVTPPAPVLAISPSGANEILSWSAAAAGFQLQFVANITPTILWSNVTQTPVTNGGQISVTLPISAGTGFFRLEK